MLRSFFGLLLFLPVVFAGCNIINPAEPQPTYVRVDSVQFVSQNPTVTGGSTARITSVFATYDGEVIGTFRLPARIPVLAGDGGTLRLEAGVFNSGNPELQLLYPFYAPADVPLTTAQAGTTIPVVPVFRYYDSVQFVFAETFEATNKFIKLAGDTSLVRTSDATRVIDGTWSGQVVVDAAHPASEIISTVFKPSRESAYVEIDYRCSLPFEIGVQSVNSGRYEPLFQVLPTTTGAKLYFSIENYLSNNPSGGGYVLRMKTELGTASAPAFVVVDNIKVVSY